MTDNEIIEELSNWIDYGDVNGCLLSEILNLINRQKAKIEELKSHIATDDEMLNRRINEAVNAISKVDDRYAHSLEEENKRLHKPLEMSEKTMKIANEDADLFHKQYKCIKSESIKEFTKELIYKLNGIPQYHFNLLMVLDIIKNTVKEMTEGENG